MTGITVDSIVTGIVALTGSGLTYAVKRLYTAVDDLRRESMRIREQYQLKTDAQRDQEQIMHMLEEVKRGVDRLNERVDRRIDRHGGA